MYKFIVTDTSPLITLAVADELPVLLIPQIPIEIPDAVFTEATRIDTAPGAMRIINWINRNRDMVQLVPTETGLNQRQLLDAHQTARGMGEKAAIETLDIFFELHPNDYALLLFEDTDIIKRRAFVDERASLISTGEFLRVLELEKKIPSAEHILNKAALAGRTISRLRQDDARNVKARQDLREQVRAMR